MEGGIPALAQGLERNPGAAVHAVQSLQISLGVYFPQDYVRFMVESNGAEGRVGNTYLVVWPLEEIVPLNQMAAVSEFAPGLLLFGSDGGDTAYAFDTRSGAVTIVDVPYVGMDYSQVRPCGTTFTEFLEHLAARE